MSYQPWCDRCTMEGNDTVGRYRDIRRDCARRVGSMTGSDAVERGRAAFARRAWGDAIDRLIGRRSPIAAGVRRPGTARDRRLPGRPRRRQRRRLGARAPGVPARGRCRPRRPLRVLAGLRPAQPGRGRPRRRLARPRPTAARRRTASTAWSRAISSCPPGSSASPRATSRRHTPISARPPRSATASATRTS